MFDLLVFFPNIYCINCSINESILTVGAIWISGNTNAGVYELEATDGRIIYIEIPPDCYHPLPQKNYNVQFLVKEE